MWVLSFYGVSTAISSLLSLLVSIWSEERARALARVWAKSNLWVAGIKVEVEGKENLPIGSSAGDNECGFIIAANHTSAADIFAILAGLRLDICWVARASLLTKPFMGWHLKRLHIPLARGSIGSAKRFIQEGTCKLDSGAAVVVFPEGTWREDAGPMLPFKKGSFLLARNTKRVIVPVAIIGSQELLPPETLIPKKGTIELKIGSPIDPEKFTDLDQIAEETYRAISELLEQA
jgi:1-acyl-sn-glycerol-3-phosphate acyltransferase